MARPPSREDECRGGGEGGMPESGRDGRLRDRREGGEEKNGAVSAG